jgi:hypothetical protein
MINEKDDYLINIEQESTTDEHLYEENNSDKFLIIFSGFGLPEKTPIFIFRNFLKKYKCDKLFLRDLNKLWFVRKLNKNNKKDEHINIMVNFIKKYIKPRHKYIYTLGCSSGGFASILYGHLLKVDKCIAFCPQTLIGKKLSLTFNDNRFQPNQEYFDSTIVSNKYLDLKNLIPFNMKTFVYYSIDLDQKHAYNIIHDHCYLIRIPYDDHLLPLYMKKTNTLIDIIDNLLFDCKIKKTHILSNYLV